MFKCGSLDLSEESMTPAAGSAVSTVLVACPTSVLRGVATGSLSLGSRLRSTATRNLGQPDNLSSLALGVGHRYRNVGTIIQH